MAAINWPASLPQEMIVGGYSSSAADNVLRSPMEVGPAKVRRRSTAGPRPVPGAVVVTQAQLATFKTWYTDTALDGTLRFDWVDPDDGVTAVEMRFTQAPSWQPEPNSGGLTWRITLPLEIMP